MWRSPRPELLLFAAVILTLGLGYLGWTQWQRYTALDERGRPADAVVVAKGRGVDHTTVRFRTEDGREVTTTVRAVDTEATGWTVVGDRLPIRYDPRDPTAAVRDARATEPPLYRATVLLAGLAAVAALVSLVLTIRNRRARALHDGGARTRSAV